MFFPVDQGVAGVLPINTEDNSMGLQASNIEFQGLMVILGDSEIQGARLQGQRDWGPISHGDLSCPKNKCSPSQS